MPDYLDEVAELLNEGLSLRKASRRVGRHHKTVAYALRRAGIEIPQARITCEIKNEIETLLQVGAMSQREVAQECSVSQDTVRRIAAKIGTDATVQRKTRCSKCGAILNVAKCLACFLRSRMESNANGNGTGCDR